MTITSMCQYSLGYVARMPVFAFSGYTRRRGRRQLRCRVTSATNARNIARFSGRIEALVGQRKGECDLANVYGRSSVDHDIQRERPTSIT